MPRAQAKPKIKKSASQPLRAGAPKLLVEPEDGISALLHGIDGAKRSVDILIFRFDHREVEQALLRAARRGVRVRALIAYTNRGGEKNLRALEMRLLGAGIIVARSADNLARYHGKMLIVDERKLFVLAFNFTYLDIEHSRSFGVILEDRKLVREAMKLFESDVLRQPYTPGSAALLISPLNARAELAAFLEGAKKELLIYDPNVSDSAMLRILTEKSKAGVEIKILGGAAKLPVRKLAQIRLHARVILRDGRDIFIGSQSLRTLELDGRREVGVIFRDPRGANRVAKTFQSDWELAAEPQASEPDGELVRTKKIAKRVAKELTKEMPPVAEVLDLVVKEVAGDSLEVPLNPEQLQDTVTDALKRAVKEAVRDAVHEAVEHKAE
ncbi:MAG: phospholipase D-like domain-containing protein [Acidobacteriota bacterium]|nr:phospholipase D-like domain-containing protein [Acidobacteriota bacterium]